jgi:4-hydroxy-2-oxoglutarate aldolase
MRLSGVFAPICTPFDESGNVHYGALRENLAKYTLRGLNGFVVCGSTGEAPFLSQEEKRKLYQFVRENGDGSFLIAGTATESVRETLVLIHDAAKLGYDAALVLTPHYYRSQMSRPETQASFFRAVADSSPLPVVVYNFPQMTGIDIPVEVVTQLSEYPNIIGIKDSSAGLDRIESLRSALPDTFDVLVGNSAKFHESLSLGVNGGILGIANVLPRLSQMIYDGYQSGDVRASRAFQQKIVEACRVSPEYGIQGLKYAMELKGYFGGPTRLPLLPLDARQKAEIELLFHNVDDDLDVSILGAA